jgi:choline dehydrogenase-like flavoprotein
VLDAAFDVCIVGTGPAGLACAMSCRERGLRVLMLEAGGMQPVPGKPDILAADIALPGWHDPVDIVSASALGGTSHWWGGRSVPFDPVDFSTWPIGAAAMAPWYEEAANFLGAKAVHETPAPGAFSKLTRFDASRDETWCPQINMAKRWRTQIEAPDGPAIVLHARVTELMHEAGVIVGVGVRVDGETRIARARHVVLACGGLGGLRLMLMAQRENPSLFGGPGGLLGRNYMGHLTGTIADLAPSAPSDSTAFAFRRIDAGVFARRRIRPRADTVTQDGIANTAFWLDNAYNENPAHGSSVSSAKYVAARLLRKLASLGRRGDGAPLRPHMDNILRAPVAAAMGLGRAGYLLLWSRLTGRLPRSTTFVQSGPGMWQLHYHAEQWPDPANRVSLSEQHTDSIGLPQLHINFRMSERDMESVVRAHDLLDADLQTAGAGRLHWRASREECLAMVGDFARDGYHQVGGAVMSDDPARGVVDAECRVHGIENLWVASSSVFPSGSHANPTLTIVALARRIAARLARVS